MGCARVTFSIAIALLVTAAVTVEGWVLLGEQKWRASGCTSSIPSLLSARSVPNSRGSVVSLEAARDDKKGGYKFGDFTKAIGRKVTGDDDYKVGSCVYVVRWCIGR